MSGIANLDFRAKLVLIKNFTFNTENVCKLYQVFMDLLTFDFLDNVIKQIYCAVNI